MPGIEPCVEMLSGSGLTFIHDPLLLLVFVRLAQDMRYMGATFQICGGVL